MERPEHDQDKSGRGVSECQQNDSADDDEPVQDASRPAGINADREQDPSGARVRIKTLNGTISLRNR